MRKLHALIPASCLLLLVLFLRLQFGAQSTQTPLASGGRGQGSSNVVPPVARTERPRVSSVAPGISASRVIVKLRAPLAALVEPDLSLDDLSLSAGTATSPQVADFMSRYSAHSLAPVHPAIVRAKLRQHLSAQQFASQVRQRFALRARRLNASFEPPDISRTYLLQLESESQDVQSLLSALRADPNVEYAEPDAVRSISYTPNDPYFSSSGSWGQAYPDLWGLQAINVSHAWDTTFGNGVVVAVVDTGLDYNHPDISANVWTNPGEIPGNGIDDDHNGYVDDVHGWNFVANTNNPLDDNGHGTHVSGTIAAVGNNGIGVIGIAWQAKVMPVKALDGNGSGYDSVLAEAIDYAANNGADVISNSWGGYGSSQTISEAVSYAYNLGAVVVAAAGNSGEDALNYTPANIEQVITVAATTPTGTLATFSNYGPKIDVGAPGVDILSLEAEGVSFGTSVGNGYTRANGTSMAAPHVSGAAALILAQHPTYSNEQVRQVLRSSATDMGSSGYDLSFGYGGLNASAAMSIPNPLEAKIQAIEYGSSPTSPITITGIARGTGFASYTLEYGSGTLPTSWTQFQASNTPATGALGQFDPSVVANGSYTIRLTAYNTNGGAFSDRVQVLINTLSITSPAPSSIPTTATSFKPGKIIPIIGTVAVGRFQNYQVSWAAGLNATSGWQTTGITLTSGGSAPIVNGQLATWDTSSATQAGYYTIQVAVPGFSTSPVTTTVYLQPALLSTNWPVWLDQGFNHNVGLVPAVNADGSLRLVLAGSMDSSTAGALWTLGVDGSSQKTSLPGFGGNLPPVAANLDNSSADQAILAYPNQMCSFHEDLGYTCFPPATLANFNNHPIVVEDLDGDSQLEVIAVGNNYRNNAYVYAWRPTGQLVNSNFPIQIGDMNPLSSWVNHQRILVGDFAGDGKKEIVVQDGISSTTFTLRLFAADGTPLSWNVPVLTGTPMAMVAADLDHNGMLETILVSLLRYPGYPACISA